MATIPVKRTASTRVAPLPAGKTGANLGPGLGSQVADVLEAGAAAGFSFAQEQAKATRRIHAREDTVKKVRSINGVREQAEELFQSELSGGDFADSNRVKVLQQTIDGLLVQAENNTTFALNESRFLHQEALAGVRSEFRAKVVEAGLKGSRDLLNRNAVEEIGRLSADLAGNPAALPDTNAAFDDFLDDNFADGFSPEQTALMKANGRRSFATATVEFHLGNAQWDAALEVMRNPLVAPFLGDAATKLRVRVFAGQGAAAKERAIIDQKFQTLDRLGITVTPGIAVGVVTGMNLTGTRLTFAQEAAEINAVLREVDPNHPGLSVEQLELLGDVRAPLEGGNSLEAFQSRAVLDFTQRILAGERLNSTEIIALQFYAGALQRPDKEGNIVAAAGATRAALRSVGLDAGLLNTPEGRQQFEATLASYGPATPTRPEQAGAAQPIEEGQLSPEQEATGQPDFSEEANSFDAVADDVVRLSEPGSETTFFEVADKLTGIASGFSQAVSRIAIIGNFVKSRQVRAARAAYNLFGNDLIAAMQRTERFGKAERDQVQKLVTAIDTSFAKDPEAVRGDMIGLDDYLLGREKDLRATMAEGVVSAKQFRDNKDALEELVRLRSKLGVPPLVKTMEDLRWVKENMGLTFGDTVRREDGSFSTITVPIPKPRPEQEQEQEQ